jgi:heat shock protein HtpX
MFKRVALFLATNLAVLVLLGIVMSVLQKFGFRLGDQGQLMVMAAIFGFGGSFISLLISKWMAKRSTGAHVIEQPRNELEQWLVATVHRQAERAGIGKPEVAIYDAPEINAFATGANRNNALVAVSTGLLRSMSRDEAEAVLGHEVSHVANGDMVTMALIQGVLNTFVIVLSRVVGRVIDGFPPLSGNREGSGGGIGYFVTWFVLDIVFGLFASMIAMAFSRHPRVPRRCRWREAGRSRQDGRRVAAAGAKPRPEHACRADSGLRDQRRDGAWPASADDDSSSAGGAHRCAEARG